MADAQRVQLPRIAVLAICLGALGILAAMFPVPGRVFLEPVGTDVSNKEIRDSAKLPVLMWCWGWPVVFLRRPWWPSFRPFWTFGCLDSFTHIAIAFHLGHGWSHAAAWEHTRAVGGYGDGIFVNYVFALVWLGDVAWGWASPSSYLARPRWLHWTVHGFIAFVVFNAAVVFAGWESRVLFGAWFASPFVLFAFSRRYLRRAGLLGPAEPGNKVESDDTTPVDNK